MLRLHVRPSASPVHRTKRGPPWLWRWITRFRPQCPPETNASVAPQLEKLARSSSSAVRGTIQSWLEQKCGKRTPLESPAIPVAIRYGNGLNDFRRKVSKGIIDAMEARQRLAAEIDRNFERGRISAVGYDYCEIAKPDPATGECMKTSTKGKSAIPVPSIDHSSVVTARKRINGKCHYFLQNHLGTTCKYYLSQFSGTRCEAGAGGFWITQEELTSLHSVISIR